MTPTPENWCSPQAQEDPRKAAKRTQQERDVSYSSLCAMGWRPIMLDGLLRDLLIRHFATPLHIEEPDLRRLVWRDDERTGILIESNFRWRGELVEKRPAVIIRQNAREDMIVLMGDRSGITEDGHYEYTTWWVGSHTVFCIHGSGAGAQILATEVQRELTRFAPAVRQYLNLPKWRVVKVGEVFEVEEARESFAVPITVAWAYHEEWRLELESMKLRKTPLSVLLNGALVRRTK